MKKTIAIVLSVLMVVCMMPGMAFADVTPLSADNVTLDPTVMTYTGSQLRPTVKIDGTEVDLQKYDVVYGANVNSVKDNTTEGTVTVKAKDGATHTGEVTKTFDITPKNISTAKLDLTYNFAVGEKIAANQIVLKDDSLTIKAADYAFDSSMASSLTEGKYTITSGTNTIKLKGTDNNYTGTVEVTIYGYKNISSCTVTCSPSETAPGFVYDSSPKTFTRVTVKDGDTLLKENLDYILKYSDNVDASSAGSKTAKLEIIGLDDYGGSQEITYAIDRKPIGGVSVENIENQSIGATPQPVIRDTGISGSPRLTKDVDYSLDYTNNNKIGTATLTIIGKGNYTGAKSVTFQIKDSISSNYVTYTIREYDYTGSVITPLVAVRNLSKTYVLNRDYKIVNANNIKAGTYTFSLVGIGNYGGTFYTGVYTIKPKTFLTTDTALTLAYDSVYYNGKEQVPGVTVRCAGRTLTKDVDYTLSYYNNKAIGTATVYVYGKGNYSGSASKTFKILGKDIASMTASLSPDSYIYDGKEKKPTVTLYDGKTKLSNYSDYTVSYKDNKYSGTATVTITGKGNYSGTKTLTFDIVGMDQKITTGRTYYTKYLASDDFSLNARTTGDSTLAYVSDNPAVATVSASGKVSVTGTGTATIKVSTVGDKQYNPTFKNVYITVKPNKPAFRLSSPGKGKIKVLVTKVSGATKYQIRYGRFGKYSYTSMKHLNSSYKKQYKILKNKVRGRYYFVKVRSCKVEADGNVVFGNWSITKKIRVN